MTIQHTSNNNQVLQEPILSLLDSTKEWFFIIDTHFELQFINKYLITKYLINNDYIGLKCYQVLFNRDEPCENCPAIKTLNTQKTHRDLIDFTTNNDLTKQEYITTFPIIKEETLHYILEHRSTVNQGVSDKKKFEKELLKIQRLESLGILAGGIAHEFNNMLMIILGNVTLARMRTDQEDKRFDFLEIAEKTVMKAKDLTQQLLVFAQGEDLSKKPIRTDEFLLETIKYHIRGDDIRINIDIDDNLWETEIDISQFSQALNNVIINARQSIFDKGIIDFKAGNIRIGVVSPLPIPHGNYVKIEVRDNGVGIPANHINLVFDPFFTTKANKTGLGLSTSYSIIKKHKGYITVKSEEGYGSTFIIYVPAINAKIENKPEIQIRNSKSAKILVMDDVQPLREVLEKMLAYNGYIVENASDGQEVLVKYRDAIDSSNPFNLVILDLTVPSGMGGVETLAKLQEMDPEVKAIISTGYSNDPVLLNYKEIGFLGYIIKPYTYNEVIFLTQRALGEYVEE